MLLLLLSAGGAHTQDLLVPFDEAGTLELISDRRAAELGLFLTEYPGFVEARLFRADGVTTLEVLRRDGGNLVRTRLPLTPAQLSELRARVAEALERPEAIPTQNARSLLLGASTLLGLAVYGPSLPVILDIEDAKTTTALYMLTASSSFFVPWLLTGNSVTPAMAQAAFYGGTRGYLHGGMLHYLLVGEDEPRTVCELDLCYTEDDDFERGALGSGFVTGLTEGVVGSLWAKRSGMTGGEANSISLGGDWGLLNGLGLAHILGADEAFEDRSGAALGLAGAAGGVLAGHAIARRRDYSYGDAELLGTAGWLGAFSSVMVLDVSGVEESESLTGGAMAAAAAGLYIADRLVEGADFTYGQSSLVRLGTIAGGLLGVGTGTILESDEGDLAGIMAAAGAVAGFATTYGIVASSARTPGERSAMTIDLAPHGIASLLAGRGVTGGTVPLVSVGFRF